MLNLFITKYILGVFIFFTLCKVLRPSICFIIPPSKYIISKTHIHRSHWKMNTLLQSKSDDSSNEENKTRLNDEEYDINSVNVDLNEESESQSPDSTTDISSDQYNKFDFDKFEFDEENYKKIINSFDLFKGPSYSLSEYNKELPEGCRTIVDYLEYPRNYDFSKVAEISSGGQIMGSDSSSEENPDEVQGDRMEGPYLKSAYETIGNIAQVMDERYTTRKEDDPDVEPEEMYNILKNSKNFEDINKSIRGNYEPFDHHPDLDSDSDTEYINTNLDYDYTDYDLEGAENGVEDDSPDADSDVTLGDEGMGTKSSYSSNEGIGVKRKDDIPLSRINPNSFMFDTYGHLQYYLKYINDYKYDLFSYHSKRTEKPSYYLNYEYIKKIDRPFPPDRNHTQLVRKYFLSLIPSLMDKLVEYLKNDPNKNNVPSPPMHDLSLLFNFKPPKYLSGEDEDESIIEKDQEYYEKYASLKGLHDPENNLLYPYHNIEPILVRKLLSTYLDIYTTGDLGPLPTYKKYKSKSKYLKSTTFQTHTRPPEPISTIDGQREGEGTEITTGGGNDGMCTDNNAEEFLKKLNNFPTYEVRTKVYEMGKKKRGKASVYLEPGNGNIIINNRDGYQYVLYNEFRLREILEPLSSLRLNKHFNIIARVDGGGTSGQSVAIRHALVKYLYRILSPKLKYILRKFDLVAIDRRRAERKKTNLRKARKKEMYSKR